MDHKVGTTNKTVAIIGAGVCGMTMTKACIENDLKPTVFERTAFVGGLWRYREKVESGQGSVMRNTIVNSSKEMTAFSDFPFPDHFPNFMPNDSMYEYLLEYGNSFQLKSYIRFEHEVLHVKNVQEPNKGFEVTVKDLRTETIITKHFDAVAVCNGRNHTPFSPLYPDQELFQGRIIHSHDVRTIDEFRDKRVVVVGIGNSGGDVASDAAPIARQVYISSRRGGTWLICRTGLNGRPIDTVARRRLIDYLLNLLPYSLRCSLVEFLMQRMIGHDLLGLRPDGTRFFGQHVMVNDHIPTYIHMGWIKIRYNIERFTSNGVVFRGDGGRVTECDIVVMATGYQLSFPFLFSLDISTPFHLYKHMFDPRQPHPERLAFIGLVKPNGSLPPVAEIQSRWFAMLLSGKCRPLPEVKKMYEQIQRTRKYIASRYGDVDQFFFEVEMMSYMDSVARSAGIKPPIAYYLIKDPKLWWALLSKPAISAQYRLHGTGAKPKLARKLIMTVMERIKAPYQKSNLNQKQTKYCTNGNQQVMQEHTEREKMVISC